MFCQLFGVSDAKPAEQPSKKKKKAPEPTQAAGQEDAAPFQAPRERSPEPMPIPEYKELEEDNDVAPDDDEWDECRESDKGSDSDDNYDATSITMSEDNVVGSLESSPGLFFERRKTKEKQQQRPPGIQLSFDDDSWID